MAYPAVYLDRIRKATLQNGTLSHVRELSIILGAYFIYLAVTKLAIPGIEEASLRNGERLIALEKDLGFFWEPAMQEWALGVGQGLVVLFNWIYIITYWPVILTVALIFYLKDKRRYFYYRTIILMSFAIALVVFALFPSAPPRMMEHHGITDTIFAFGPSYYGSTAMETYYNATAALPSLHFAWTTIFGLLFFRTLPGKFKVVGFLYPSLTFAAIVITGNHYIIDAMAGGALMLLTWLLYEGGKRAAGRRRERVSA